MAQIRGTAGYHLGTQGAFGSPSSNDATNDPSPLDAIREQTSKIEDYLDTLSEPIKPYVQLFSLSATSLQLESASVPRLASYFGLRQALWYNFFADTSQTATYQPLDAS